jgi:hypothetical protein
MARKSSQPIPKSTDSRSPKPFETASPAIISASSYLGTARKCGFRAWYLTAMSGRTDGSYGMKGDIIILDSKADNYGYSATDESSGVKGTDPKENICPSPFWSPFLSLRANNATEVLKGILKWSLLVIILLLTAIPGTANALLLRDPLAELAWREKRLETISKSRRS